MDKKGRKLAYFSHILSRQANIKTLGMCEGDCDSDSHCESGLKCFQRDGKADVPGCVGGGAGDRTNYDYCTLKPREVMSSESGWQLSPHY